ncbi:MAG TPA: hypothetical protein VGN43_00980 [Steroidobacteraceae bacterium]|jgi:catechol 2,3-dioxygenase-like lactoylglutathione lyase family enzyme|nr:hypothetical protein [Steroidobacteraceae bacterium]
MLGRFLEIGIATQDIRASVEFYERLGFTQAQTGDAWRHPYGVLTDGRVYLGLHQARLDAPALTFVRPGLASQLTELERARVEPSTINIGGEVFNEIGFRDPAGLAVRLLEARTYSPAAREPGAGSLCGAFRGFSAPAADFERVSRFWEALGFVAADEEAHPYPHLPLRCDGLELALHRPRFFAEPMLVFQDGTMPGRISHLRELGIGTLQSPPAGLGARANAMLLAPEGTALLLLEDAGTP